MDSAYSKIININTLNDVLLYLKSIENKKSISVWLDWDENIINSETNTIIEPEVTKELFDYMIKNRIFFSIITGRFYDSACDDKKRNIFAMENNIVNTIFPVLRQLGVNTNDFNNEKTRKEYYKIYNEKGKCIGFLYMGIIFSHYKGDAIKNYLRQNRMNYPIKIFVDDYEVYLMEVASSVPDMKIYRRHVPYPITADHK